MVLMRKPEVRVHRGRWWVKAVYDNRVHIEHWRTHLSAMNCALAIARTSRCATEEERCCNS